MYISAAQDVVSRNPAQNAFVLPLTSPQTPSQLSLKWRHIPNRRIDVHPMSPLSFSTFDFDHISYSPLGFGSADSFANRCPGFKHPPANDIVQRELREISQHGLTSANNP